MLKPGLYEQLITDTLRRELAGIPDERQSVAPVDKAEAAEVLSRYVAEVTRAALERMQESKLDVQTQIALVNRMVQLLAEDAEPSLAVDDRAEQLLALLKEKDPMLALGKRASDMVRPETSLATSSLFTGAVHEPQMFSELKKEIASADRIDMLVSFIKWSGLRLIIEELQDFTGRGGQLRIITTSSLLEQH